MQADNPNNVTPLDAPDVPGLTFRLFRGDEDYPEVLRINSESKIADGLGHDLHTLETLKHVYGSGGDFNPQKDLLFAEINGSVVAFARVFRSRELDGSRVYTQIVFVLPEWRGKGIEQALLRWAQTRSQEREASEQDGAEAYMSTDIASNSKWLAQAVEAEGYEPVRYLFHMGTEDLDHIPDAPMPEGLELRPAKPEHYRAIWEAEVEAFRDHWGAHETSEQDYEDWLKYPLIQPDMWVVAWDGDQVAGSILNFINPDYNERMGRQMGYTEDISVRRPWRRKGLARAMLSQSMKLHKAMGMTQTLLSVDTQNPSGALQLYESMGYRVLSTDTTYRKPISRA